jgi:hypothetical protein
MAIIGYTGIVREVLADHVLTGGEEGRVLALRRALDLADDEVGPAQDQLAKAAILRDLDEGRMRLSVTGPLPVILKPGDSLLWLFQNVTLQQFRTRSVYVGRSQGTSIRIMKGVYYRAGASRGERISTEEMTPIDNGSLVITRRNVMFKGDRRGVNIPMSKILSVDAYSDGIAITKDGVNAKPQILILDDPWFAANLVLKAAAL